MVLVRTSRGSAGADSRYIFQAKCQNVRGLHAILKAVAFRETAVLNISESGLRVIVEELKCLQGNAFLQRELFDEFVLREESVNFCLNITVLCECLNLFGGSTSQNSLATVKFCYAGYGAPLKLLIEESGIVTDCAIKTMEPDSLLDFDFSRTDVVSKIIMKPEPLRDTFNEMDATKNDLFEISVYPDRGISFSTVDPYCTFTTEIPKDSEIIDSFTCTQAQSFKYRVNLLKLTVKALQLADKISNRIDQRGFLSIQYMIDFSGHVTFIEFECAPECDADLESVASESTQS